MTTAVFKKYIVVFSSILLIALILLTAASSFTLSQNRFQVFAQSSNPTEQYQLFLPILDTSDGVQLSDDALLATTLKADTPEVGPVLVPSTPTSDPFSLTWEIQVSFDENNDIPIIAHWIMNKIESNGTVEVVQDIDISSDCTIEGDVLIEGTSAVFDEGYIVCDDLPDFVIEASGHISNTELCSCQFDLETPPWIAAKYTITGNNRTQPLIVLADGFGDGPQAVLQYEAELIEVEQRTNLHFNNGQSISSQLFPVSNGPITTFSGFHPSLVFNTLHLDEGEPHEFLNIANLISLAMDLGEKDFLSWYPSESQIQQPNVPNYPSIHPGVLYIGWNPNSPKEFFEGEIETIIVDPGCQAN